MFKKLFFIMLTLFSIVYSSEKPYEANLGYLTKLSVGTVYSDSQKALNLIVKKLAFSIDTKFNLMTFDNTQKILNSYKFNQINIIGLDLENYLKNLDELDKYTIKYFTLSRNDKIRLDKLVLLVNKDSNIKTFKDLKSKKIALKKEEFLSKIYSQKIEKKHSIKFADITYFDDYYTLILKTFFEKYDSCIVPLSMFETLKELNPNIKSKLLVLDETKNIYSSNILLVNNTKKDSVNELEERINRFKYTKERDEIFSLLNVKNMYFLENNELDEIKSFYQEYLELELENEI